jgi:hypothetical protein
MHAIIRDWRHSAQTSSRFLLTQEPALAQLREFALPFTTSANMFGISV